MKTIKLYIEAAAKLVGVSLAHPNTDHRIIFQQDRVDVVPANATKQHSGRSRTRS